MRSLYLVSPALVFVLAAIVSLISAREAHAYPNYISYGYHSCTACHYDPLGNGPLNDYGRSVAATELTDRLFWGSATRNNEERLSHLSGFFFGDSPSDWLRPSASYRGLFYETNPGQANRKSQWINMDASAALVGQFLSDNRLIFVGQMSFAPRPLTEQGSDKSYANYRSRDAYVGYRLSESFGVYAGLMDRAFGIRVPDHISYSRTVTRNTEDDQTYGVMAHYLTDNFEWALQPFVGNLVQQSNLRQKGVTTQLGWFVTENSRLGASASTSQSQFLSLVMYAVDARMGFGKGNSLLFEVGQVDSRARNSDASGAIANAAKVTDRYVFLQNQWLLRRGLSTLFTAEMLQPDTRQINATYRFGPGLQYFPTYRLELRADVYDTHEHSATYADDSWTITGQVHLWF